MKKFLLVAVAAVCAMSASAQQRVYLNTYSGTNVQRFDGQECLVTAPRYVCKGWNTVALPFAMTEEELNEAFGSDCRLERLVGAKAVDGQVVVDFQDCKAGGIEANTPYILYYSGENGVKMLKKQAVVESAPAVTRVVVAGTGDELSMQGAQTQVPSEGKYGILAKDNAEATFVNVNTVPGGFAATRCFITLSSGNDMPLVTRHLGSEATAIESIAAKGEQVDVYTVAGKLVATRINAGQVNSLPQGVYVVKGRKVVVK